MRFKFGYVVQAFVFILLCLDEPIVEGKDQNHICPIGYSFFYAKENPFCYRSKGRETFAEKYKDCAGNLFNLKLYNAFKNHKQNELVWTEYKSIYSGSSFVDWSYTKNIGENFEAENITIDPTLFFEEELCLVVGLDGAFIAVKCNEKHHSYCVVKPYMKEKRITNKGCEGLNDSLRFWSPEPTCLSALTGVAGANIRATWNQAQNLCINKGGSLLNRGWRYSNYPKFSVPEMNHTYPLGIIMSNDYSLLRYDATSDHSEIPNEEWNFKNISNNTDTLLGSLHNDAWDLVNSSYIFYNVICERVVPLRTLKMDVAIDSDKKLTLTVNDTLDEDDIYCFTDSRKPSPVKIKIKHIDDTNMFVLSPEEDGYYWCTHIKMKKFRVTESNKILFIREEQSLINKYAVKLRDTGKVGLSKVRDIFSNYIYWKNSRSINSENNVNASQRLNDSNKKSSLSMELKKVYMDGYTVLLHVQLNPDLKPVTPVRLNDVEILSMKPVYFCKAVDSIPQMTLGESIVTDSCQKHSCVGDFNEGVQIVTTITPDCTLPLNKLMAQVSVLMPTVIPSTIQNTLPILGEYEDYSWDEADYAIYENQTITTTDFTKKSSPSSTERTKTTTVCPIEVITVTTPPGLITAENINTDDIFDLTIDNVLLPMPESLIMTTTTISPDEDLRLVLQKLGWVVNGSAPFKVDDISDVNGTAIPKEDLQLMLEELGWRVNGSTIVEMNSDVTDVSDEPEGESNLWLLLLELRFAVHDRAALMVDNVSYILERVNDVLEAHDTPDIPGELLHLLDQLGSEVDLNGSRSAAIVYGNIALVMADASPNNPIRGLKIARRDNDVFNDEAFEIFLSEPNSTVLDANRNEVVVHLPQSLSETSYRISFVVFRNNRAFQANDASFSVNSKIISIKIGEVIKFEHGEVIDIHLSPVIQNPYRNMSRTCAYWQFLENGSGYWSQEGCRLIRATEPGILDTCRCNHLTHFAEVLFPRSIFSQEDEDALELLTIIGCCLSFLGLMLVVVTAATFRSWRRVFSNKIWLQLCVAIFLLALSFLIIIFAKFDHYDVFCMLMGIVLHYSVLTSFCWMLVAAVLSYRQLVLVFTRDISHKLLRASAFSWGAPCAVISVLLSIDPQSYAGRFEEKSPSGSFCYPSGLGLWLAVYAPIAIILVVNWMLFALIVRSVSASRGIQKHGDSNEALRCALVSCLLVFLFGLPWIFGLFAFNIVAAYLFTITATYQGFLLFLFFVLGNKKTRDLWLNKLTIKQAREYPVTSSTNSNKSTGRRGATKGMIKPKSHAQDDCSFV